MRGEDQLSLETREEASNVRWGLIGCRIRERKECVLQVSTEVVSGIPLNEWDEWPGEWDERTQSYLFTS